MAGTGSLTDISDRLSRATCKQSPAEATAESTAAHPTATLITVCIGMFMLMLDMTIVAAALANIQSSLDASLSGLQWVVDAYTLPVAALLLTAATLGDRLGRRRLYIAGMSIFTLTSLGCALAGDIVTLNVVRAVQGVGAALLFGVSLPLVAVAFPDPMKRARAIGIYGAVMASATAAGPLVGGALVTAIGWEWIFLINVPIGIAAVALAYRYVTESRADSAAPADWAGTGLLTLALLSGVLALIEGNEWGWSSTRVIALGATSIAGLLAFIAWELRAAHPMLDLRLVVRPAFAANALAAFAGAGTLVAATNFLALYFINTLGHDPFQAGLRALPLTLSALVVAPPIAVLHDRLPARWSLPVSMGVVAAGLWLCTGADASTTWTHYIAGSILGGAGLGAVTVIASQSALTFVEVDRAGMATGAVNTARQVGIVVGVAGLGAVFSHAVAAEAGAGLASLTVGTMTVSVPDEQADMITEALGSGAGQRVIEFVPDQFAAAVPALSELARGATAQGLDAVMATSSAIAAVATLAVFVLLRIGRR
ncbi:MULTISPECIES: MFS transporter [unclassified Rhodococcus (in: high G+C Gram-positive bacteria)]|uniref:MFS transporter n=1 Tax=unclassified Rhodococcus (in: high G+C Gram-positive bacteria) TaxID=192944 RepID=UPI000BD6E4CE|nr:MULTISPECIES: MFS transporter [unclassified Rhodococcus (in: high G+C Gram-positive bacteria)]MBP1157973.1 EmrB/QacA subfamily drug resistance transporter [Rhodococcus sp. PvR099]PTR37790.1 EmrB/QacA subfamily drug resistance transporter [Rhodococcus sp. OK611]SNX93221.1 drug resistance transporter, EmrB/QacA subfamily [Rhodococcus sp. OK270]